MDDIFTNREIAEIIVTAIITIYALFRKQVRTSLLNVIICVLNIKIIKYFFSYLFYFFSIVYLFYILRWWDTTNLKDTIIWFIFSGLSIGIFVGTNKIESDFWKKLILDNLKFNVLVEFIISLFTFSLIVEFTTVSILGFIVLLNRFSKINNQYKAAEKFTDLILTFIGLFILVYSLYTVTDVFSIVNMNNLKSFLFPVLFSIISVPYMYIFKLIVEYDNLFRRLELGRKRSKELNSLIKRQLILFCNFNIEKLQIATNMNNYNLMSISSKDEIDVVIKIYKNILSQKACKIEPAETRAVQTIQVATQKPKVSANTHESEATLKFSDSKKEELVVYMTEFHSAKEVEVIFISSSNIPSDDLLSIDYYIDTTPTRTVLNNNIANIAILSGSLAKESGISNPNVLVYAKTMDGTLLGIGKYYSSIGKAFIDVSFCP